MIRLRAIAFALFYGLAPSWVYEDSPHYAPMSYRQHLVMNLGVAGRWLIFRETAEDRQHEIDWNGAPS